MLKALPYLIAILMAVGLIIQGINSLNRNTIKKQELLCEQAKENELLSAKNNQENYLKTSAEKYQSQKDKIYNTPNNQKIHSIPVRDILNWMRDNCADKDKC